MVAQSVRTYNHERLHSSLKMQTPDAVHRASLATQPWQTDVNAIQDGTLIQLFCIDNNN